MIKDTLRIKLFDLPGDMYPLINLKIYLFSFQVIKTVIFTHMRPKTSNSENLEKKRVSVILTVGSWIEEAESLIGSIYKFW